MSKLLERAIDRIKQRKAANLQRCAKACFCDENGALTYEGGKVLADLRSLSGMFDNNVRRLASSGAIDKDLLLELEGRRQVVLRLLNLLELDPLGIAHLTEVDDA